MCLYIATVIWIGLYYAKRANASSDNFLIGGRKIGPWVTALGAEASDMSGWLLMGLPGVAYWFGLSDAFWTALGLLIGTYLNWLFVSKRLRGYSAIAGNSITIPDFFSNRFKEEKKVIAAIASLFVLVFFTVYASSCFVTVGKLLAGGVQQVGTTGEPLFGTAGRYGLLTVISTLSWGLGYFGMPQVLLKFMAIRKTSELTFSRRIATIWCAISLTAAVSIGIIGRALFPAAYLTQSYAENIFILLSKTFFFPLLVGFIMAGILAATISSSDSYLLIAASALSKSIYHGILRREATDKQVLYVSRITLLVIAVFAMALALDEKSIIFKLVSFAWAGFGVTFGPIMLFSLFWKRVTRSGAIAGMLTGGGMVFIWNMLIRPLGGAFDIYELFPAFVLSCLVIVVVSLLSKEPSPELQKEFELAKTFQC
mgnify:CR=1 FL=1